MSEDNSESLTYLFDVESSSVGEFDEGDTVSATTLNDGKVEISLIDEELELIGDLEEIAPEDGSKFLFNCDVGMVELRRL
jgi:hypothetical protein